MTFQPQLYPGTLHHFSPRLVAFEQPNPNSQDTTQNKNTLIWIGGLGDGLLTVHYPKVLTQHLPPNWTLVHVLLSSSYSGWGTSSLRKDAKELGQCVDYFKKLKGNDGKVVLMGHSTGSQDVMEYLVGPGLGLRPKLDGAILQAGISDREGFLAEMPEMYHSLTAQAGEMVNAGRGEELLPKKVMGAACTAYRWLSLASPDKKGDDDYFSSDLDAEQLQRTFGAVGDTPLLILFGEKDQHMPQFVDKEALVKKWMGIVKEAGGTMDEVNGGVVPGASHNLDGDPEAVVMDLVRRVGSFLERLQKEFGAGPHL